MAGDWIKLRASLLTHPKLIALCRELEGSKAVGKKLSTGFGGALREIVTRDVTRDVTLASLFRVWCAANEHTSDGVWHGIELEDLDHVAGIPGFGDMMEAVGWAIADAEMQTVSFPNFLEYNTPAKEGRGKGSAERQRRYREKQRAKQSESDVTRDVVSDVTRYGREEKRREELTSYVLPHEDQVIVPQKMQTPEVEQAMALWIRHLQEKEPSKIPHRGSPQMQGLWQHWSPKGPDRLVAAISYSVSNQYITLHEPPAERHTGAFQAKGKERTSLDSIDWGADEHN